MQWMLGTFYYYGHGVPQDYALAVKWFRKAADQGYAAAQVGLGACTVWAEACRRITPRR
jgi:hypothetical protein